MATLFRILLVILITSTTSNAIASNKDNARTFILAVSNNTLEIIENNKLNSKEKEAKLAQLFSESVDTEWIGKFVLGKYWRAASEEERSQYITLYKKFLIGSYVPRFKDYTNERISILNVIEKDEGEYLVKTEIVRPKEPSIKVDYLVRKGSSEFKIFDIVAEGISLITTQRSEFGSVISRKGLDYLIDRLSIRVDQMSVTQKNMIEATS